MSTEPENANLRTDYYDFELPKSLIAQEPLPNREDARLLMVDREKSAIDHAHVRDLHNMLRPGDCLVLNDTKVVPAQLTGLREQTGGRWQGLFLEADEQGNWRMLAKTRGKIQAGEKVILEDRHGVPRNKLVLLSKMENGQWIGRPEPENDSEADLASDPFSVLQQVGRIPLPHYIRGGKMVDADIQNYQTIFAKHPGAVAAPTAGLHLTKPLIGRLIDNEIQIASVTLHVGIGTFRPVTADSLGDHSMHSETGMISEAACEKINNAKRMGGRVIAVGTTSIRVLETAGASGELRPWSGETDIFIKPGFRFNVIDGMITNFHLPRSTLLVLVRTFGGDKLLKQAYQTAIEEEYRFFSYGDAMLIT